MFPHREAILSNVAVGQIGTPAAICITGEPSASLCPLLLGLDQDENLQPVGALWCRNNNNSDNNSISGGGRVVALAHEGYLVDPCEEEFIQRCIQWCSGGGGPGGKVYRNTIPSHREQQQEGSVGPPSSSSVVIWSVDGGKEGVEGVHPEALLEYVLSGRGSAIVASCAWGWCCLNPTKTIDEHPCNTFLRPLGLSLVDKVYCHGVVPSSSSSGGSLVSKSCFLRTHDVSDVELLSVCSHPRAWEWATKMTTGMRSNNNPNLTNNNVNEVEIPQDSSFVESCSNGEDLSAVRSCFGGEGGWYATVQVPFSITFNFGTARKRRNFTSLQIHCVNVDACPKTIRVFYHYDEKEMMTGGGGGTLVATVPFPTAKGRAEQNTPFDIKLPPWRNTETTVVETTPASSGHQNHHHLHSTQQQQPHSPPQRIRVLFEGIHNSHYIGVNNVIFREARREDEIHPLALKSAMTMLPNTPMPHQVLVLSYLQKKQQPQQQQQQEGRPHHHHSCSSVSTTGSSSSAWKASNATAVIGATSYDDEVMFPRVPTVSNAWAPETEAQLLALKLVLRYYRRLDLGVKVGWRDDDQQESSSIS